MYLYHLYLTTSTQWVVVSLQCHWVMSRYWPGSRLTQTASDWFLPGTSILRCIDGYYHVLRSIHLDEYFISCITISEIWVIYKYIYIYIIDLAIHIYSLGLVYGGLPALPPWAGAVLELTRLCFCQTGSCLALALYGAVTKYYLLSCYCILVLYNPPWYDIMPPKTVIYPEHCLMLPASDRFLLSAGSL